jgi:site-specific DNA-methyltransferase (adenine-specific)
VIVHVLRKPLIGTVAANALQHGCGALNIDECRIGFASEADKASAFPGGNLTAKSGSLAGGVQNNRERSDFDTQQHSAGRWPANLVHDGSDEVVETFPESNRWFNAPRNSDGKSKDGLIFGTHPGSGMGGGDSGSTARYFQQVEIK